jgi:pyridoxine 4-dehydrogenase
LTINQSNDLIKIDDLTLPRFGFGAMRLPGPGIWGEPADRDEAVRVVRRAYELGIRVIDTAWYYGWDIANGIIAEALAPYPDDLVIITKLGGARREDGSWYSDYSRAALRAGCRRDLQVLRLDSIPVVHLRYIETANVPFEEALESMLEMRREGMIQRIGLSNVTLAQLDYALTVTPVATVSNRYSVLDREYEPVLSRCEERDLPFLPFFPLVIGKHDEEQVLHDVANAVGATPAQVALKWLLAHSPVMLPIPGTGKVAHLEENLASASIELGAEEMDRLDRLR